MYCLYSRYAVTIFLLSVLWGFPVFSPMPGKPLIKGYLLAVFARGAFHSLGGYLYWMSYMPENFPKSLTAIYPIVYNYSYLLAEAVLTVIILSIPAVSKALNQIKNTTSPAAPGRAYR